MMQQNIITLQSYASSDFQILEINIDSFVAIHKRLYIDYILKASKSFYLFIISILKKCICTNANVPRQGYLFGML